MQSPSGRTPRHLVVGAGRWGSWLAQRLVETGQPLRGIVGDRASARALAHRLGCAHESDIPELSQTLVWLCLPDDRLSEFAAANHDALSHSAGVIHASGSAELLVGDFPSGVCWPIQSITQERQPDWATLPFVVEASSPAFAKTIVAIARTLGNGHPQVVLATADRQRLHLAATLTQNFGNLLWTLASDLLAPHRLDYRDLLPLAHNHLAKLLEKPPALLQTGPAVRGDAATLRRHEAELETAPEALEIYRVLTREIIRRAQGDPPPSSRQSTEHPCVP